MPENADASSIASSNRETRLATALGAVPILVWGATLAWVRTLSDEVGAVSGGAWMCIGATIALWAWRTARQGLTLPRVSGKTIALNGTLFAAYLVCFSVAVGTAASRVEAVSVGLVNYLWPSVAMLIAPLFSGRRITALLTIQVLVAVAGTAVAVLARGDIPMDAILQAIVQRPLPYIAALLAALCWSLYSNTASVGVRDGDENPVSVYLPMAALATGMYAWVVEGLPFPQRTGTWISLVTLSIATAAGYICWDFAMRKGNTRIVGLGALFTPILSVSIAGIAFGERLGWNIWAGASLIVVASLMSRRP
jgi:drug/metabolite transporter (DMT)-like permease